MFTLPGLPAPGEQAVSRCPVTSHPLCQTHIIARRTTCLPHDLWSLPVQPLPMVDMYLHVEPFVPSLSAQSDQLCVLTLPVFISWSTCSRRADCQQQSSHLSSGLSDLEQAEKLRQALVASLSEACLFYQPHFIQKILKYSAV